MKQHTIPKCYLESFTDPNCPDGHQPYLWMIDREKNLPRKKSPKNVLVKTDFYTIELPHGEKDYSIESSLSQLESEFMVILRNKIIKYLPVSEEEMVKLSLFFSALFNRTISQKDHWEKIYEHLAKVVEQIEKAHKIKPKESINIKESIPGSHKERMVENLVLVAKIILLKNPFFLISDSKVSFITSDNPYIYLDPQFDDNSFYQPVPTSRSTNLLIPLTPKIAFYGLGICDHQNQYMKAKEGWVKGCNHSIANHSYKYIFSSKKEPDFLNKKDLKLINSEHKQLFGPIGGKSNRGEQG
jgi:hypothetical protein